MPEVHVIGHPLVQHKLTIMRKKSTSVAKFRTLLEEISMLMGYEVTRDMPLSVERIETPLMEMDAPVLEGKKVVVISILRAGDGILNGIMKLLPSARVGHIGLYRDPNTLEPVEYYFKVPQDMAERERLWNAFATDPEWIEKRGETLTSRTRTRGVLGRRRGR